MVASRMQLQQNNLREIPLARICQYSRTISIQSKIPDVLYEVSCLELPIIIVKKHDKVYLVKKALYLSHQ